MAVGLVVLVAGCQRPASSNNNAEIIVEQLQQDALSSDLAWDMLASLTSEVGPRMAGSPADKLAVRWAIKKMKDLGFDRVWTEPV